MRWAARLLLHKFKPYKCLESSDMEQRVMKTVIFVVIIVRTIT